MGINTEKGTFNDATFPSASTGSYTVSNKTVAMELYYIYLFRKYIELYTFAGVGPTSSTEQNTLSGSFGSSRQSESKAGLKGQYTPIGIRAGGRLGAYAELGYGYKGLVNLGISFKLGPSCWWSGDF